MMRIIPTFVALAMAGAILAGCSGSSSNARTATPPAAPSAPAASLPAATGSTPAAGATSAATPNATPAEPGDQEELTGIVGTVTASTNTIQVTRLSGADVEQVQVTSATVIRSATGGRLDLGGIRTSDRIIADGHINDRGDALVAEQIAVSSVVPGAQPGG